MDRTSGTPVPPESFSFSGPGGEHVGAVFTPPPWARFAVLRGPVLEAWLGGASVLDPCLGQGNLLEALVDVALERGYRPDQLPFDRLFGIEIVPEFHQRALERFRRFGVSMEAQFVCGDLFSTTLSPCDLILGNPPWQNFSDLPEALKPGYKQRFLDSGLVGDPRTLLLGGARIDVAALVVQFVMESFLRPNGQAWFFLPLSLLLNEGAHAGFRRYRTRSRSFAVQRVWDFGPGVFPHVSTRHALVEFQSDRVATFPVPYEQWDGSEWTLRSATPTFGLDGALSVSDGQGPSRWADWMPLKIESRSRPRQGLNTGGANRVYFFTTWTDAGEGLCLADGVLLPKSCVHPLLPREAFHDPEASPQRWVLIPHGDDGRPFSESDLQRHPELVRYLGEHRGLLENRRGALLASLRRRGLWWALLGVGPYSFAPYKVFWQAYGRAEFLPVVRSGTWQANQSLQAFIPCWSEAEAQRIASALRNPAVAAFLESTNSRGTKSWAQPGRIRRLLEEIDPTRS